MLFRSSPSKLAAFFAVLLVPVLLLVGLAAPAGASGDDVSNLAFMAADADSYDHASGGGFYGAEASGSHTAELDGEDFACGDTVSFLNVVELAADATDGPQTIEMTNTFAADAGGIGFTDIMNIVIDPNDPGQFNDDESQIGVVGFGVDADGSAPWVDDGDVLSGGDDALFATYVIDDLDAGETIVVRVDVRLECAAGADPAGELTSTLAMAGIVADASGGLTFDPVPGGELTVALIDVDQVDTTGTPSNISTAADDDVDATAADDDAAGDTAADAPEELPLTGDGADLAALIAVAIMGAGMLALGAAYRRGVGA